MQTEKKIYEEIRELTLEIEKKYPELRKYLDEMPLTVPDKDELTIDSLKAFRDSLKSMIKGYKKTH